MKLTADLYDKEENNEVENETENNDKGGEKGGERERERERAWPTLLLMKLTAVPWIF